MRNGAELNTRLLHNLRTLHLPTVRESFEAEAVRAIQESMSYEQYLLEVTNREVETRQHNRVARLLRESRLPLDKTWESFKQERLPRKVSLQFKALLDGGFLDRRENVLAFGRPGSGKTHLLCALSHELIHRGRAVLFTPCALLVQELLIAKRDLKLARVLKRLGRFEAIFIDDIGYVQQSREEMEVLFALLADRYERSSILLTSNLKFSKWEAIFKDPMTTAAAIDRLIHHCVVLELNLKSYRFETSQVGDQIEEETA